MDGTFGGGDLISASLAIMLGGEGDAELHDKEVALTTSDVTGSQTAIFEYDPENEPTTGTPAGPWDGYSLFTIDLSGIKDDIEDLQQQVSDLEDELEEMQDCCEDVAEILDATPEEGESCCDAVKRKAQDAVDKIEECGQCKADVVAKLQEYNPNFDPQTCDDIPPEIDNVYQKGRDDEEEENPPGYTLPAGTDPSDPNIQTIVAGNPLTDNTTGVTIGTDTYKNPDNSWGVKPYYIIDGTKTYMPGVDGGTAVAVRSFTDIVLKVTVPTTGEWEGSALVTWNHPFWTPTTFNYNGVDPALIGYGSTSDTYTVKNS